jgi:hypothetical protein
MIQLKEYDYDFIFVWIGCQQQSYKREFYIIKRNLMVKND